MDRVLSTRYSARDEGVPAEKPGTLEKEEANRRAFFVVATKELTRKSPEPKKPKARKKKRTKTKFSQLLKVPRAFKEEPDQEEGRAQSEGLVQVRTQDFKKTRNKRGFRKRSRFFMSLLEQVKLISDKRRSSLKELN